MFIPLPAPSIAFFLHDWLDEKQRSTTKQQQQQQLDHQNFVSNTEYWDAGTLKSQLSPTFFARTQ